MLVSMCVVCGVGVVIRWWWKLSLCSLLCRCCWIVS